MTDLDIAKSVQPKQIAEIAKKVNIPFDVFRALRKV